MWSTKGNRAENQVINNLRKIREDIISMKQEYAVKEQEQSGYKIELLEKCHTSSKDILT